MNTFEDVVRKIREGRRFLIVSHINPEGDAVGSLLGLALALRSLGKDVVEYLEDPVPGIYGFLPGASVVAHSLKGQGPFDATLAVDCGKKERLGREFQTFQGAGCLINIDHHATNDRFGDINVIIPEASATGEAIYDLCKALGVEITQEIAVNLYVAILTDTGSFRYSCTTPGSLGKAGELLKLGIDPWDIASRVYENHPARKWKLLGMVLGTLEVMRLNAEHNMAILVVTLDMFRRAGAEVDLSDGFVNYARGIEGVEVGILFRECGPDEYKVSLRSKKYVDVSKVAMELGGGGHSHAAGFNIRGTLPEVKERVIKAIKEEIFASQRA